MTPFFPLLPQSPAVSGHSGAPSQKLALQAQADLLEERLGQAPASAILGAAYGLYGKDFALVSSFGAESAVLLHLLAGISKNIPVLFIDTGQLFDETKAYRTTLANQLGLTNIQDLTPLKDTLDQKDPDAMLWQQAPNHCCYIRKIIPLEKALQGYQAWASGRKRYQGFQRAHLRCFEVSDGRLKINPLAHWSAADILHYQSRHNLPKHPLVSEGFNSIGCMPCTARSSKGRARSGRWPGQAKTECGIHLSLAENQALLRKEKSL